MFGEWIMVEQRLKATVVWLIVNGKTEKALGLLAQHYHVDIPKIVVGLPKGRRGTAAACYDAQHKMISVSNSDAIKNPFIVLHEFYHHLRTCPDMKHRGTEKHANGFAKQFIQAYQAEVARASGNN